MMLRHVLPAVTASVLLSTVSLAQVAVNPIIPDYGTIYSLEGVRLPAKDVHYKVVVDLKAPVTDPSRVNSGLNNLARFLNLHGAAGLGMEDIHLVVAVHGGATSTILSDEGYQEKHGVPNPNLPLLTQLREAGVEMFVCGQSLIARGYDRRFVSSDVEVALSMLTVVTEHMMKGHGLLVFQ